MRDMTLATILAAAFFLRLAGIGFGLPAVYHQDEPILVNHALAIGLTGWNMHFFVIGPFTIYLLFGWYAVYFAIGKALGVFAAPASFAASFLKDPTVFYLIGRFWTGVFFGTATVAVLAKLGRRFFSKPAGEAAALFLAIAFLPVQHSHYIYADIPLTFWLTLFFYFFLRAIEEPSLRNFGLAGAAFGAATATKYTALYFVPAATLGYFTAFGTGALKPAKLKKALWAAAAALAVFFIIAPYTFLDWQGFRAQLSAQSGAEWRVGPWHHFYYSILNGLGPSLVLLAALGLASWIRRPKIKTLFLLYGIAVYYAANVFYSQPFARYMLPLVPLVCLAAADGWCRISEALAGKIFWRWALFVLVVGATALPAVYSDLLFFRNDTRTLCAEWLDRSLKGGETIVVSNRFDAPRLRQTEEQLREKFARLGDDAKDAARRKRLELELEAARGAKTYRVYTLARNPEDASSPFLFDKPFIEPDRTRIEAIGAEYLIFDYNDKPGRIDRLRESIADRLDLVAVFSPFYDVSQKTPRDLYGSTAAPAGLADLFGRRRLGPYLEVYKVRS